MRKRTTPAQQVPIPQSLAEAEVQAQSLQRLRQETEMERAAWEERIAAETAARDAALAPLVEVQAEIEQALEAFCQARRTELTNGGKRQSVQIGPAKVRWRKSNAVRIADEPGLIEWIKRQRTSAYKSLLKTSVSVMKAAIAKRPEMADGLPGVTIELRETFEIKTGPVETVSGQPSAGSSTAKAT